MINFEHQQIELKGVVIRTIFKPVISFLSKSCKEESSENRGLFKLSQINKHSLRNIIFLTSSNKGLDKENYSKME